MSKFAIRIENISKKYKIGQREPYKTLRDMLAERFSFSRGAGNGKAASETEAAGNTIWALKDVSFEVEPGEVLGLIGRNGAGKSTLLKILSRITEPTEGRVRIRGRVGSLLEVGTGFNPELTGRENILLNGAILGMTHREIERKFDEIVSFAEVEKFIETPVKRYSSGMYMRLAFSVAAHLEPEILLVDEVLSVGDIQFQQKCLGKIGAVAQTGRTVLFVSHNLGSVWSLCSKAVWLNGGKMAEYGSVGAVIDKYRAALQSPDVGLIRSDIQTRKGSGLVRITQLRLEDPDHTPIEVARSGDPIVFVIDYVTFEAKDSQQPNFTLIVLNDREQPLFALSNSLTGQDFSIGNEPGTVRCLVPNLPLVPGEYNLNISCTIRGVIADRVEFGLKFSVTEGDFFGSNLLPQGTTGQMLVSHSWEYLPNRTAN
jgi:lipopolysaccharide transport system ATP-binding protein